MPVSYFMFFSFSQRPEISPNPKSLRNIRNILYSAFFSTLFEIH